MSETEQTVDEAIEQVASESEGTMASVKEALDKAHHAMDGARSAMQEAYGKAREKSVKAAERTRVYMEDAKKNLVVARESMSDLAAKTREQAEVLYARAKEQYEALSARSRELYGRMREKVSEIDLKEKGDQVLEYIRINPGKSVLIALAVGFVVGYATRPRD